MVLYQKLRMSIIKQRIKSSIQLHFLRRLSRTLESGYTLSAALETLTWDRNLQEISNKINHLLKGGRTLDQALDEIGFHPIITTYLYFAKDYGDLETSIIKCVELYEKRLENTKKFTQIIRYPIILIIIFSSVFFFIQHSVLPNLLILLQGNNSNGLSTTLTIISFAYYGFLFALAACFVIRLLWKYLSKKIPIDQQIKIFKFIPIYRSYLKLNTSFQFSTHFGSLLKTGLSVKDVLSILTQQQKLPLLAHYAIILMNGLNKGHQVTILMDQFTFINPQLASIFQKNSNTESLEKDLSTYSAILTDELNQKIMKTLTYIQPMFFILLGILIILIYLSLIVPMYGLINEL